MDLPKPTDLKSSLNAIYIEHHVARIIGNQETHGVLFNKPKAERCIKVLQRRQERLYVKIRPTLSLEVHHRFPTEVKKPFIKTGGYSKVVTGWFEGGDETQVVGPFTRVEFKEPDLGKLVKLKEQLLRLGWVPREFTPKGSPKLTVDGNPCPSLEKIDSEIGSWISTWHTYRHRQSQIQGWLDKLREDGRLSAGGITIGTPTYRFRHRVVVNIPRATSVFGWHMRSLFHVPKGKKMVGFDASGLELRMLADAINDILYTNEVINGDIHTKNQNDARLPSRDDAKTFIYAFIYGAGDAKIGAIIGGSRNAGRQIKAQFLQSNPALAACIEATRRAAGRGWLAGLDGRRVTLRRDQYTGEIQLHKALNTRLQCAGALVMKWAMVILDHWVTEMGLDAHKVIDMHDEAQWECSDKDAHMVGTLGVQAIVEAGKMLNLNVPLAAEYKVGHNWAMTH